VSYSPGTAKVVAVDQQLQDRDVFLAEIRERLLLVQDTMKEHQNKRRRPVEFVVGDWVWLHLHKLPHGRGVSFDCGDGEP